MKKIILFLSFLLNFSFISAGFTGSTLVNTPKGLMPLQSLKVGDAVICYNGNGLSKNLIESVQHRNVDEFFKVTTHGGDVIYSAKDARFFMPKSGQWHYASDVKPGNWLLCQNMEGIKVKHVERQTSSTNIFDIGVQEHHNFGISENSIIVHNMTVAVPGIWGGLLQALEYFGLAVAVSHSRNDPDIFFNHWMENHNGQSNDKQGGSLGEESGGDQFCACGHLCGIGCNCGCFCGCGKQTQIPEKSPGIEARDEIIKDALPGRKTKGKSKQHEISGGEERLFRDFEKLKKKFPDAEITDLGDGTFRMILSDGTKIMARLKSSDRVPTLEFQYPWTKVVDKVRYGPIQQFLENAFRSGMEQLPNGMSGLQNTNGLIELGDLNISGTNTLSISQVQAQPLNFVPSLGQLPEAPITLQGQPIDPGSFVNDLCKMQELRRKNLVIQEEPRKVDAVKIDPVVQNTVTPTNQNSTGSGTINSGALHVMDPSEQAQPQQKYDHGNNTGRKQLPQGFQQNSKLHHEVRKPSEQSKLPEATGSSEHRYSSGHDGVPTPPLQTAPETQKTEHVQHQSTEEKTKPPLQFPRYTAPIHMIESEDIAKVARGKEQSSEIIGLTNEQVHNLISGSDPKATKIEPTHQKMKGNEGNSNSVALLFDHNPKELLEKAVQIQNSGVTDGTHKGKQNDQKSSPVRQGNVDSGVVGSGPVYSQDQKTHLMKTSGGVDYSSGQPRTGFDDARKNKQLDSQHRWNQLMDVQDFTHRLATGSLREEEQRLMEMQHMKNDEQLVQEYRFRFQKPLQDCGIVMASSESMKLDTHQMAQLHVARMQEMPTLEQKNSYARIYGINEYGYSDYGYQEIKESPQQDTPEQSTNSKNISPQKNHKTHTMNSGEFKQKMRSDTEKMVAADCRRKLQGKSLEEQKTLKNSLHCDDNGYPLPGYELEKDGPRYVPIKDPVVAQSIPGDVQKNGSSKNSDISINATSQPFDPSVMNDFRGLQFYIAHKKSNSWDFAGAKRGILFPGFDEKMYELTKAQNQGAILNVEQKRLDNCFDYAMSDRDIIIADAVIDTLKDVLTCSVSAAYQCYVGLPELRKQVEKIKEKWACKGPISFDCQRELNELLACNDIRLNEEQRRFVGAELDIMIAVRNFVGSFQPMHASGKPSVTILKHKVNAKADRNSSALNYDVLKYSENVTDFPEGFNGMEDIYELREKRKLERWKTNNELMPGGWFSFGRVDEPACLVKWKSVVDQEYKTTGRYLNEADSKKLDILLANNKIEVNPTIRLRLEKQCALNLKENPGYFDGWLLDLNVENVSPNKDVIRNMGDVFESRRKRAIVPALSKKYAMAAVRDVALRVINKNNSNGNYTNDIYNKKLDAIIRTNKLEIPDNTKLNIQQQLFVNCSLDPEYREAFLAYDTDINASYQWSNSHNCKTIQDVFSSVRSRYITSVTKPRTFFHKEKICITDEMAQKFKNARILECSYEAIFERFIRFRETFWDYYLIISGADRMYEVVLDSEKNEALCAWLDGLIEARESRKIYQDSWGYYFNKKTADLRGHIKQRMKTFMVHALLKIIIDRSVGFFTRDSVGRPIVYCDPSQCHIDINKITSKWDKDVAYEPDFSVEDLCIDTDDQEVTESEVFSNSTALKKHFDAVGIEYNLTNIIRSAAVAFVVATEVIDATCGLENYQIHPKVVFKLLTSKPVVDVVKNCGHFEKAPEVSYDIPECHIDINRIILGWNTRDISDCRSHIDSKSVFKACFYAYNIGKWHRKSKQQGGTSVFSSKNNNNDRCPCGHFCASSVCNCGCSCGCGKKEWKKNKITKQEFFKLKEISENYEHVRDGIYRLKKGGKPLVKDSYYLRWDHLHGDVEVWNKSGTHIGSIDPQLLELYKGPQGHELNL